MVASTNQYKALQIMYLKIQILNGCTSHNLVRVSMNLQRLSTHRYKLLQVPTRVSVSQ